MKQITAIELNEWFGEEITVEDKKLIIYIKELGLKEEDLEIWKLFR